MTALLFMSEHKNFRVRDYIAICLKTSFRSRDRFFFFFFFFFVCFLFWFFVTETQNNKDTSVINDASDYKPCLNVYIFS